jgi:hypothetical protein
MPHTERNAHPHFVATVPTPTTLHDQPPVEEQTDDWIEGTALSWHAAWVDLGGES